MYTGSSLGLEEQLILRIDREISEQLDSVITKMQKELAEEFTIEQITEKSPFKNVLTVAIQTSSSLEVIKNYIRYQLGRQQSSKIWKLERIQDGKKHTFANRVVQHIDNLSENFKQIFDAIDRSLEQEIDKLLVQELKSLPSQEIESLLTQELELPLMKELELLKKDSSKPENLKLLKKYLQKNHQGSIQRRNLELLKEHLWTNEQRLRQTIHLSLAQLYLGYLAREHTARVGEAAYRAEPSSNRNK